MTNFVEIDTGEGSTILNIFETNPTQIVSEPEVNVQIVEVIGQGPQGPRGPQGPEGNPGGYVLGGYAVNVSDLKQNDLVQFSAASQEWVNLNRLDGGNF